MDDPKDPGKPKRLMGALYLSIIVAGCLALIKVLAALVTRSMAILASALDSLMDVGASIVNLLALQGASQPPDEEHAYGHEKIESLAGLFQSVLLTLTGLYIVYESVRRLIFGEEIQVLSLGIGVMLFAILATLLLVWRLKTVSRHSESLVMKSEKLHYVTDILSNVGVIVSLVLVALTKWVVWDLLISIAIAIYVCHAAYEILRKSIDELLDRALPPQARREIESLVLNFNPSIAGIHNLRTRKVGGKVFLDFHIEIGGQQNFNEAHQMTESLIEAMRKRYTNADVTVHFDPEGEI
ncbi:MAG: cation transporter [Candidatus Omnitrophica bacterium]|nr:cation transporter [Candidatus Omnitrophota bacterium]